MFHHREISNDRSDAVFLFSSRIDEPPLVVDDKIISRTQISRAIVKRNHSD